MPSLRTALCLLLTLPLAVACENPVEEPPSDHITAPSLASVTATEVEPNNACQAPQNLGSVTLPLTVSGSLDGTPLPSGDVDFVRFTSTPDTVVTVDLEGQATGQGTLGDPFLGAFDSGCNLIALNDDNGVNLNSRLVLTIPADGILVLGVTTCCDFDFSQGGSGSYRLTAVQGAPPPTANFGFNPFDPSVFDVVQFFDFSFDPGGAGIASQAWDLGDGATGTGCCPTHRYAADGSYTVQLTVTTFDGRTASTSQTILVSTHDVAITRLSAPKAASAGQTRQIVVGVNSKRSPETVEVLLLKSAPGGFQFVGVLTQAVPVRRANRTTDFSFSYTFTSADAQLGKVTFKAVANLVGARDALPADNEAIASPTTVSR